MNEKNDTKKISVTARVSAETHQKLLEAIEKSGMEQSDIMREALDLGLDELGLIGYKIKEAVRDAIKTAKESNPPSNRQALSKTASTPTAPVLNALPPAKAAKNKMA